MKHVRRIRMELLICLHGSPLRRQCETAETAMCTLAVWGSGVRVPLAPLLDTLVSLLEPAESTDRWAHGIRVQPKSARIVTRLNRIRRRHPSVGLPLSV